MKIRIENGHGRHLGTYQANDVVDAADQYAREHGFGGVEDAEAPARGIPLFKLARLEFIDVTEGT